jgi:hypothetical protein
MEVRSQPKQTVCKTLSQKNLSQKRAGGVTQGIGPEFNPQYRKKKTKPLSFVFGSYQPYVSIGKHKKRTSYESVNDGLGKKMCVQSRGPQKSKRKFKIVNGPWSTVFNFSLF